MRHRAIGAVSNWEKNCTVLEDRITHSTHSFHEELRAFAFNDLGIWDGNVVWGSSYKMFVLYYNVFFSDSPIITSFFSIELLEVGRNRSRYSITHFTRTIFKLTGDKVHISLCARLISSDIICFFPSHLLSLLSLARQHTHFPFCSLPPLHISFGDHITSIYWCTAKILSHGNLN